MRTHIVITVLLCSSCFNNHEEAALTKSGSDPANLSAWYRTPEFILATIEGWGEGEEKLAVSDEEKDIYINSLGLFYGGIDYLSKQTPLEIPNNAYVMTLSLVSSWIAYKLLSKEFSLYLDPTLPETQYNEGAEEPPPQEEVAVQLAQPATRHPEGFLFRGRDNITAENPTHDCDAKSASYCYHDDSIEWCDCFDGIGLNQYHAGDREALRTDNHARKRLMHNIQDIGDFLGVAIDNGLPLADYQHAPQYLLDEIFIPNLACPDPDSDTTCSRVAASTELAACNANTVRNSMLENILKAPEYMDFIIEHDKCLKDKISDYGAWVKVVYTILMSGKFYMNLHLVEQGG